MHTMAEIEYTLHANVKQIELLTFACNQALRIHIGQLSDPLTVLLNFEIGHARHHQGELCPFDVQEILDELTFLCWEVPMDMVMMTNRKPIGNYIRCSSIPPCQERMANSN